MGKAKIFSVEIAPEVGQILELSKCFFLNNWEDCIKKSTVKSKQQALMDEKF